MAVDGQTPQSRTRLHSYVDSWKGNGPRTVPSTFVFANLTLFSHLPGPVLATQNVLSPEIKYSSKLWWGRTWHMQTPLETLGPGSTMVFELRDIQVKAGPSTFIPEKRDGGYITTRPPRLQIYTFMVVRRRARS